MQISVIIPCFNSEKTIKKTIDSVLEQTFTDFELIVVNDGSTDSTLDIISKISDPRIKVFSYPNSGANITRNRGFCHSVGEYISFLDADDVWTSDKLKSQWQTLQENVGAKVAYSWTDYIDENGEFLLAGTHITANGNVYEKLLVINFLENGSNPLIRREAVIEVGGFDESLQAGQDWDMWLRLAQKYDFVAVPAVQILYRIHKSSMSSNLARQEKACLLVINKAYSHSPDSLQHLRSKTLTNLYNYLTCKALQQPFNRQKGIAAAIFLFKNIINDSSWLKRRILIFKLLLKIAVVILLPPTLSTAFLTSIKKSK